MFAKLCVLITAVGICGGVLLAQRQMRLLAVHQMARVQQRIHEHDQNLFRLRTEIASRITPERIEEMVRRMGEFRPIVVDHSPAPEFEIDPWFLEPEETSELAGTPTQEHEARIIPVNLPR